MLNRTWIALVLRLILATGGIYATAALPAQYGPLDSYSAYYEMMLGNFSILFSILAIGLMIHADPKWQFTAGMLVILACFDKFEQPVMHYTAAALFFIGATVAMWNDDRVEYFGKLSLMFYPTIFLDMLIFEAIQIWFICTYHLIYVIKIMKIKWQRDKIRFRFGD